MAEHILRAKDAMAASNILKVRYSGMNLAMKSVLMEKIGNCVQGDLSVKENFEVLSKYWREYDEILDHAR